MAALCWCLPHQHGEQLEGELEAPDGSSSGGTTGLARRWEGFPRGPALLSYLHQAVLEAGTALATAEGSQMSTATYLAVSHCPLNLHVWFETMVTSGCYSDGTSPTACLPPCR